MNDKDLSEFEREKIMDGLVLEMHFAHTREERIEAWDRLRALHQLRSAEKVAQMERERGLCTSNNWRMRT
jgi:hypothetical protein